NGLEFALEAPRTRHRARMQQRLVLPRPCFFLLILGEGLDVGNQQAAFAAGTQADVDLVEPARGRMHSEQVNDPLREPHEEHLIIDRPVSTSFLALAARVVQKDQIEIGRVAELHSPELAVAYGTDRHVPPRGPFTALGRAELLRDLAPSELN